MRRCRGRTGRRRSPARPDRGRHSRPAPCADRASSARGNRANRRCRAGASTPSCSSKPLSSSSAVSSVQAFSVLPSSASGIRRRMPLPRPTAVSNLKIASIAWVPARVTLRGAARSGSIAKPRGAARGGKRPQLVEDRVGAVEGLDVPAQRQHVAPIAVAVKQRVQQTVVGPRQRFLELRQPIVGAYRNVVGLVEHARFSSPAVCAAFSCIRSLYPFGMAQKGRDEMPPIPTATGYDPVPAARGR